MQNTQLADSSLEPMKCHLFMDYTCIYTVVVLKFRTLVMLPAENVFTKSVDPDQTSTEEAV